MIITEHSIDSGNKASTREQLGKGLHFHPSDLDPMKQKSNWGSLELWKLAGCQSAPVPLIFVRSWQEKRLTFVISLGLLESHCITAGKWPQETPTTSKLILGGH